MDILKLSALTQAAQTIHSLAPEWLMPITNEAENDHAIAALTVLMHEIGEQEGHPLEQFAALLSERIQDFEDHFYSKLPNDPAANLRYALEQRGLSQHALAQATGIEQATISRLCTGKRDFTTEHIRRLAAYFGKEPGLFLSFY